METAGGLDESVLVAEWLDAVWEDYPSDEERGATIGAGRSIVGEWRKKVKEGKRVGLKPHLKIAMKRFLSARKLGSDPDAARAVIQEMRDKLDEMESRLPPLPAPEPATTPQHLETATRIADTSETLEEDRAGRGRKRPGKRA